MEQADAPCYFSHHNAVLKCVRDSQEFQREGTKELSLDWQHRGFEVIPVVEKPEGGGQDYCFSETVKFADHYIWDVV